LTSGGFRIVSDTLVLKDLGVVLWYDCWFDNTTVGGLLVIIPNE